MNIVTGCSGVDAIAYAATLIDIDIIGQVEIDEFCNKILELRYPGVKRYKNIFDVKGDEFGAVDIFAAGFPCQCFSVAGKRKGDKDDRYLWPEIARIIRTMQPTWFIGENTSGIGSMERSDYDLDLEGETTICTEADMVLETIRKDLQDAGYQSLVLEIPACGIGAPHRRYRYFIVGYSDSIAISKVGEIQRRTNTDITGNGQNVGYSCGMGLSGESRGRTGQESEDGHSEIEVMADTKCERLEGWKCKHNPAEHRKNERIFIGSDITNIKPVRPTQSGVGRNADELSNRLHGPRGQEDSNGIPGAFEEILTTVLGQILWPAGYGAEQYDYEPPRVAAGVKNRADRIKALGNAIVWPQILPLLLAIKLINQEVIS